MIRIRVSDRKLRRLISLQQPDWLSSAARTMQSNGPTKMGKNPSWSEIKAVYSKLQSSKCAYCERKIAQSATYKPTQRIQDVDHHRPKGAVKIWPSAMLADMRKITYHEFLELGGKGPSGYYLLTHHHWNYVMACQPCNQALKRDHFPIAGARRLDGTDPWTRTMKGEWPYLIFPLGDLDDDPETLIHFDGLLPRPADPDANHHDHWRARVTIDFFDLASEDIVTDRAVAIDHLYKSLLLTRSRDPWVRTNAESTVAHLTSNVAPHTACAKAFHRLWRQDEQDARGLGESAGDITCKRQ